MSEPLTPRRQRNRLAIVAVAIVAVISVAAISFFNQLIPEETAAVASFPVQQGEFVIALTLKGGELEAIKAENITAPHVRGQLKITHLFSEGEQVEVGDLLADFDDVEFIKRVTDADQQLQIAKAEMEKAVANQSAQTARLEGEVKNQQAQMRLAELQV